MNKTATPPYMIDTPVLLDHSTHLHLQTSLHSHFEPLSSTRIGTKEIREENVCRTASSWFIGHLGVEDGGLDQDGLRDISVVHTSSRSGEGTSDIMKLTVTR
jgi:hypothetical protein